MSLLSVIRQYFCRHVFKGTDLGKRNENGLLAWPCSRCGKVFVMHYGLQAPGEITGPWGAREKQP